MLNRFKATKKILYCTKILTIQQMLLLFRFFHIMRVSVEMIMT